MLLLFKTTKNLTSIFTIILYLSGTKLPYPKSENQNEDALNNANNQCQLKLNYYSRYQTGLTISLLYPSKVDRSCSCGCGEKLTGKKTRWASSECQSLALHNYYIIKGDQQYIRAVLYQIDLGACRSCGQISENWEADHIIPVEHGGGACTIENFQTLCKCCHSEKSAQMQYLYERKSPRIYQI